jgi:protein gp37
MYLAISSSLICRSLPSETRVEMIFRGQVRWRGRLLVGGNRMESRCDKCCAMDLKEEMPSWGYTVYAGDTAGRQHGDRLIGTL